jgi:Zn-dependent protease
MSGSTVVIGSILDVPIHLSFWSIAYAAYCILQASAIRGMPAWWSILYAIFAQLILQVTILVHEFGHGLMARHVGGKIDHILLWPLGGICFLTLPATPVPREKIKNDLKVVVAGPATHFFQIAFWAAIIRFAFPAVNILPLLNPIGAISSVSPNLSSLISVTLSHAITMNAFLFIFNVFFPLYPMDAAKLLTSLLQLKCNFTAERTATWLINISGSLALVTVGFSIYSMTGRIPGFNAEVLAVLAVMCIGEILNLRGLMSRGRLNDHPLFSHANEWDAEIGNETVALNG